MGNVLCNHPNWSLLELLKITAYIKLESAVRGEAGLFPVQVNGVSKMTNGESVRGRTHII